MERKERLENAKSWRERGGEDAAGVRTVEAAGKKRRKSFLLGVLGWRMLPSLASTPGGFDVNLERKI